MADYIYLLEHRLSAAQRDALRVVAELARGKGVTVFLVGGAVRDLTSGSPVRDLDVAVQGNALKLKKDLERAGAVISGEYDALQSLYVRFPGSVRMEIGSTLSVSYPKPGKPVARAAGIQDDLRRRDFTANAMALSLNEGSYGLLMDPLNGVADIENRELRLISNYGFIEEPVRMIRAARLMARLGWHMEEKTAARYRTGIEENYIGALSEFHRGYETEEIFHEEDPLRVLERLESEGWMKTLAPALTLARVDVSELERLREVQTRLQMQGLQPDNAAVSFPLLTAKLSAKDAAELKGRFPRQGFVAEIDGLEREVKLLAAQLTGKQTALPSETWKLLHAASPEVVLAVAFLTRSGAIQAKLKSFETEWPQARQKIPYQLMQEMRIVPELPGFAELTEKLFFELMNGNLDTPEAMRAYLEPYSPPAPPPPVSVRKVRAPKKEAKAAKAKAKPVEDADGELGQDAEVAPETARAAAHAAETQPVEAMKSAPQKTVAAKEAAAVQPARPASVQKAPPAKVVAAAGNAAGNAAGGAPRAAKVTAKSVPVKKTAVKKVDVKPVTGAKSAPRPAPAPRSAPAAVKTAVKGKSVPAKTSKAGAGKAPAAPVKKVALVKQAAPAKKAAAAAKGVKAVPAKAAVKPARAAVKRPVKPAAVSARRAPVKAAKAGQKVVAKRSAAPVKAGRRR